MRIVTSILVILLSTNLVQSQNLIQNHDFEFSEDCPLTYDRVFLLENWEGIIETADFYDCGLELDAFPTNSFAQSGTAYVSFASYGDTNGSAEAVGQILSTPLLPGETYDLKLAAKKASGGTYVESCGGVAIYGFKNPEQDVDIGQHISQFDDAQFLGVTALVDSTDWLFYETTLQTLDTVNYVVFTVEFSPQCFQCIFLDNILLELDISSSLKKIESFEVEIFPNPTASKINIKHDEQQGIRRIELFDNAGKSVFSKDEFVSEIDVSNLKRGLFILKLTDDSGGVAIEKIIKSQ